MSVTVRGTLTALLRRAGPGFTLAVLGLAAAVVGYASLWAGVGTRRFVHLTTGLVWIGANVVLGLVVRPALARTAIEHRVAVSRRLLPRVAVVQPALLVTTAAVGLPLAIDMGLFPHAGPWLALAALASTISIAAIYGARFDAWRDRRWQLPTALAVAGSLVLVAATAGSFAMTGPRMALTLALGVAIFVTGLGAILSGVLRAVAADRREPPTPAVVARVGDRTLLLARLQLLLAFVIVLSVL